MHSLDPAAVLRSLLILGHLMAFAMAAGAIALGDYAIFSGRRVDAGLLSKCANSVAIALLLLWVTGLAIIWADTRFALDLLAAKPKLLAKLSVVVLLTLNGLALNRFVFPRFVQPQHDPRRSAVLPAALGAVSFTTWTFAAFLGVSRGLDQALGYAGFMALYAAVLAAGVVVALRFVWPRLAGKMGLLEPASSGFR